MSHGALYSLVALSFHEFAPDLDAEARRLGESSMRALFPSKYYFFDRPFARDLGPGPRM